MAKNQFEEFCVVCGGLLVKNGRTAAGTQRWKCRECKATEVHKNVAKTKAHQLNLFLTWLLGKNSQAEVDGTLTGRSFQRKTSWCWNINPVLEQEYTHGFSDEILVDGIYIGKKSKANTWCCLIATDKHGVPLGFQWCDREKIASWRALFEQLPTPKSVVCDGGTGLETAANEVFNGARIHQDNHTRIQRCLVHVVRNTRVDLTSKPRSDAGRTLLVLAQELTSINTIEAAIMWQNKLNDWFSVYGALTKQRTYNTENSGRKWWYTHERLRRTYTRLAKLNQNNVLFTFLETNCQSTTNRIEGGINTGIRYQLRHHRGLTIEREKQAVQWYLWNKTNNIKDAYKLIKPKHYTPVKPTKNKGKTEQIGPKHLDNSYESYKTKTGTTWANLYE